MFFILSKLFWVLVKPLNLLLIVGLLGLLMRLKWRRAGNKLLILTCSFFVIFGLFPIGPNMMTYLERQYERPRELTQSIDGIIVLGGAFDGYMSHIHGYPVGYSTTERIHELIRLGRQNPNAKLVFSGGSGRPRQQEFKEAPVIEDFFNDIGMSKRQLILEPESRNTYQNALYSKKLLSPKADETWVLITSAFHMPRSVAVFEQLNWRVIPYPTDHNTDLQYVVLPRNLNVSKNFHMLE
ncbi:MAG: YdcF family protein, partial [Pseudomonadota bacterium]